jgi:hypothetical protein
MQVRHPPSLPMTNVSPIQSQVIKQLRLIGQAVLPCATDPSCRCYCKSNIWRLDSPHGCIWHVEPIWTYDLLIVRSKETIDLFEAKDMDLRALQRTLSWYMIHLQLAFKRLFNLIQILQGQTHCQMYLRFALLPNVPQPHFCIKLKESVQWVILSSDLDE